MKNIEKHAKERESKVTQFRLSKVSIKEIATKYPDKVVDIYTEGKNAVMVLDTCRIKFVNTKLNKGEENANNNG